MSLKMLACIPLCLVLAATLGAFQTPGGSKSANATGACRIYDTATTAVTVASGFTVTVKMAGAFDPYSARQTQDVSYSDTRGIRFTYTQVTTWASDLDFVAEVVRMKPPAPLSSNPPGPQLNILPPLTRSLSTVASGQIGFSLTNQYDGQNRLTGAVSASKYGSETTRYTAWDAIGRPTAGSRQLANVRTSTLAIRYDDHASSAATTTTTNGVSVVGTQFYDNDGNPTKTVQTGTGSSTTTTTATSVAKYCLGDKNIPDLQKLPKPGPTPNGTWAGSIGGATWSASLGIQSTFMNPTIAVGGGDGRYLIGLSVTASRGTGQYTTGMVDLSNLQNMDDQTFKELFARNSVVATLTDEVTHATWQAAPTIGTGTLTLTSLSASGASGTYNLTLEAAPGTGAAGQRTITGTFSVEF